MLTDSTMVRRGLDEIVTDLWPELLRAEGLPDVDAATVKRITRTAIPALRAARDRGAPDYALASATEGRVVRILRQAGYQRRAESDAPKTDFLDEKRREITERLVELEPAVDEYIRLDAAASALGEVGGFATEALSRRELEHRRGSVSRGRTAAAGQPATPARKKARNPADKRRARRRKGSGTRAAQALSFVKDQPGITIPELAAKMGIKENYLYRVLPGLAQEEKVTKKGRGWHPRG
jgi:hypothetical protein